MDKENGETSESGTGSSKLSNPPDPTSLLDAANLFGAYWPRNDATNSSNAANLFAAAGGSFGPLGPHPSMPFGLLPPSAAAAGRNVPSFPPVSSAAAYTNTLSVAASQAASLGFGSAASAAWWSMASQLAAQDYLARLQASGINFPALNSPGDPYSSLGLPSLSSHHKTSKNSSKNSSSLSKNSGGSKGKTSATALSLQAGAKLDGRLDPSISKSSNSSNCSPLYSTSGSKSSKYSGKNASLTIHSSSSSGKNQVKKPPSLPSPKPQDKVDGNYSRQHSQSPYPKSSTPKCSQAPVSSSIFTSPLSLVSNSEKASSSSGHNTLTTQSLVNSSISSGIPPNILSDPSSILGGVRLPPDTEIIKYTSSIVGPKIPGTTNRGRKKTISLDPPSVSVMPTHSSTGMLIERATKWPKLSNHEPQDLSSNDRVEVIKLPATNGSPSGISVPAYGTNSEPSNDAPLNLSLKPASSTSATNCQSSNSLNSLSNLSANIGSDRISRRKPGPKPRRVIQSPSHLSSPSIPGAPSASLNQLFAAADSPRPPSRNDESDSATSTTGSTPTSSSHHQNHKDGRPRNLGRGVSKPKKNTVASLLAQSRALGIKPVQIDPNTPMNQQISLLKSNMLAAQFMADVDEKHLEKLRGALSDSSNMEVSTDSDNLSDSNQTDSEAETDANGVSNPKKRRQFNERELRLPLDHGWKRETIIRGLTKNGGIKGDVCYTPPETNTKLKQIIDILQYLEHTGNMELTKENFTFSCKLILGDYLQRPPPGSTGEGEYLRMSEDDVTKRLDDLRAMARSNLAVEQRIEVARRQQAARAAARLDREQARIAREIEKNEKQEAAKRDREVRSQQLLEGRKRLAFTLEQKMQIISEIEGGKTKSDVSRELGLASSTVATIWKNRDHILNAYGTDSHSSPSATHCEQTDYKAKHSFCALSENIPDTLRARRKRHEELGRQRYEDQQRKIQEREMKKQQAALIKEQMYIQEINKQREMLYTVELERERRRQHMTLVKALEGRRRLEERERKKQQAILEKQASKERRLEQRRVDMEILTELRKPCEDLELAQKPVPEYPRIPGLRLSGQAFSDILMVFEFLHNFGETLGFDMESLPCLDSLQQALLNESLDAEEELLSVMTHLLVCAIEDPGIPNPARHTTLLGQSLRQADITHSNLSEILRIYLYANATGEVKALTGVHFERDREKRVADHYQSLHEMQQTSGGKNSAYYEQLHENATWRMSDSLKDKPFLSLSPTDKAAMLAFICNELLQNKAVIRQIEGSLDNVAQLRKERWLLDTKIRKYRMMASRKLRSEAAEKMQAQLKDDLEGITAGSIVATGEATPTGVDSPAPTSTPHKDDLLVDDEEEISDNESECTQPEEEEDKKLSGEELSKKLDKLLKTSETQLQSLNASTHQLRATCYGQDRYWRRYWSLPTGGGVFVEAMESAQPEVLIDQLKDSETLATRDINSVEDLDRLLTVTDSIEDVNADKEVSKLIGETDDKSDELVNNEHRKTPNRKLDDKEEVLASLEIVKTELEDIEEQISSSLVHNQKVVSKNHNLFEKLGECMENENKEEKIDEKVDIKVELKSELVKMEVDDDRQDNVEAKWFSILSRDPGNCDGVNMTSGNRWDTNTVGVCTRENYGAELKIPVFPPPNCQNSYMQCTSCDSPGPLQMSLEENQQLEYIKQHGPPPSLERVPVPPEMRTGWWRILDAEQFKQTFDNLHSRGVRERELKRTVQTTMQAMYECAGNIQIEDGNRTAAELTDCPEANRIIVKEAGASVADKAGAWNPMVATRVDFSVLEQVEALEDKVANASMQVKGWKVPNRDQEDVNPGQAVPLAKERLASLEAAIERRYLKPPLGISTGDVNLAAMAQEQQQNSSQNSSQQQQQQQQQSTSSSSSDRSDTIVIDVPKGLCVWRDAVQRSKTSAQLAMCLYMLEASIAWDKSIMKANCQFCHSGDNEDKLLLCDSCDKGYHTYCFRPKMDTIPDGNWFCHECINKVTGERNCIVCGKKQSTGRLVLCDLCPRAYHQDCLTPPLNKVPRGKWYCPNCHSKQPKKRNSRRSNNKPARDSESSDHPPAASVTLNSPAPSHSSVTTTEEAANQQQQTSAAAVTPVVPKDPQPPAIVPPPPQPQNASPSTSTQRKDRVSKKLQKELAPCKTLLEDLECHDDAWPFLLPVNTKQFPTYKKIITSPMDLSTIKKRLQDLTYKSREDFCMDVRQIFDNCETFNEDDSPVGKAGHGMRQFFEARWNELCPPHTGKS